MPCVAFYLILMHLNSSFLHKDPVVSGLVYFNQKLVVSKLCFQMACGGRVVCSSRMVKTLHVFSTLNSEYLMKGIQFYCLPVMTKCGHLD